MSAIDRVRADGPRALDALDPLSLEPGAMQVVKERMLPGGYTVRFEYAPEGWLTKKGTPRTEDWRRYFVHVTGQPVRRRDDQAVSVTTICDAILPKDGLPPWSEKMGIFGALEAFRRGLAHAGMSQEEFLAVVRANKLAADAARDQAADRGLNVHAILEAFMLTGRAPNPAEHPEPHRPFIRGLVSWLVKMQTHGGIEPVAVEMLVADPEREYAGRLDLLARTAAGLTLIDLKTQDRGAIYESAHVQTRLYLEAEQRFGEYRPDHAMVVVVDGSGRPPGFREMDLSASSELVGHALDFYQRIKPLAADCDAQNRTIREALAVAA